MKCPTCHGTGEVPDVNAPCGAVISPNGVEKIRCYGRRHQGQHAALVELPVCPECDGYDEHASGCTLIGSETEGSAWLVWEASYGHSIVDSKPAHIVLP